MDVINIIINISLFVFLIFVVFLVSFKYIYKFNSTETIYFFNKKYNNMINSIYLYFYYDKKTETLTTNYELNNGLFKDLKYNLDAINM